MADDPFALATDAASVLRRHTGADNHDVFVVLGSGWAAVADALPAGADVAMAALPGLAPPSATGHRAHVRSVELRGRRLLLALGRVHLYEGHEPSSVVHAVRVAAAAGCRTLVITNAAGAVHADWSVGEPVVISDQINGTGRSPLTGTGSFVAMSDAYSPRLRALAQQVEPGLREGVYIGLQGPEFETPAEIRSARASGADLVGMSTVLEVIAARHLGLEVLGLSLVTNLAGGVGGAAGPDVGHILSVAEAAAPSLGELLRGLLERIVDAP